MVAMTTPVLDESALQEALRQWVIEATEFDEQRVLWSDSDQPQATRPFAWLSIIAGPTPTGQHERRQTPQLMRDVVTVTGTGAIAVRVYGIDPDDVESYTGRLYSVGPSVDIAANRDALAAALAAEPDIAVTTPSAGVVQVDGTSSRRRFHLVVESGPAERVTERDALLETVVLANEITVRVQIETASVRPGQHARGFMATVCAALGDRTILRDLRANRLFYRRSAAPIDLTGLVATHHCSRYAQDFFFALPTSFDTQVPWVRTAGVTGSLSA
jgi:hypothetical protein